MGVHTDKKRGEVGDSTYRLFDKYADHAADHFRSVSLVFASFVGLVEFCDRGFCRIGSLLGLRRGREGDGDHLVLVCDGGTGLRLRLAHHVEDSGGSRVDVEEREGLASSLIYIVVGSGGGGGREKKV
jgi:hypothetical protein